MVVTLNRTSLVSLRRARVLLISFVVVARSVCKSIYYRDSTSTSQIIVDGDSDNALESVSDAPEASLPEHFFPLPWDPPDSLLPTNNESNIWFDAIDTAGNRGYVADPTLLRRSVLRWHRQHENSTYWDRLQRYQSHLLLDNNSIASLTMDNICSLTERNGGKELNDGGVTMITEYVKVDKSPTLRIGCTESLPMGHEPKLFCGIYTHNQARDFTRISALSYGWKCDGFLAFSTVTIPSLGMVGLLHRGPENYNNMVQKTRSIWSYIATHYLDEYDYFHIGGDDHHLIVENMRSLLLEHESEGIREEGRIFGELFPKGQSLPFIRGGAGYSIDRVGLKKLHEHMPECAAKVFKPAEDNIITLCARKLGLVFSDNRDKCSGQQRSHSESPGILFNAQGLSTSDLDQKLRYWAGLPHPVEESAQVGMKVVSGRSWPENTPASIYGDTAPASNHSVSFHFLRYQPWMARHHALLYRACPPGTPLAMLASRENGSLTEDGT